MKFEKIPYGRQTISEEDIRQVCDVLRSDWLTTGPVVSRFEQKLALYTRTKHAVAVSNGTAALHTAMHAMDIRPGDEVIVPPMTFAATVNTVVLQGGIPVFVDVDPDTLLIDIQKVEKAITRKTKAVIAVDYAGQMCDYEKLKAITRKAGIFLVSDACHSLGGFFKEHPSGSMADLTVFSFHPVKPITTGEGGMIVTNDSRLAAKMYQFRNHGIDNDLHKRQEMGSWFYEIQDIGLNYRLTDFQCALGISQLEKLDAWITKRNQIADSYDDFFKALPMIQPLKKNLHIKHAFHLYVIRVNPADLKMSKSQIFSYLHDQGIGVNVHYIPVHLHPVYKRKFNTDKGLCPVSEKAYEQILSLPVFPGMDEDDVSRVCHVFKQLCHGRMV